MLSTSLPIEKATIQFTPTVLPHGTERRPEPDYAAAGNASLEDPRGDETGIHGIVDIDVETLVLNLDASLRVYERAHFFSWTQGLLQSLIRHEVLICGLRNGDPQSMRVDSFSMVAPDQGVFGEMFLRDTSVAPSLIKVWEERGFRPLLCDTADTPFAKGLFAQELERVRATQILAHGTHDAEGRVTGFFAFASNPGSLGPRHAYLARLVIPFLHSAWVRTEVNGRTKCNDALVSDTARKITAREQEILKWVYFGKSNFEIGAILDISPLTVKNHVQKILRKLDVVNRAQAVGKALDLRILKT
ncbi:MAG: XrtB/PEP-CTERM-associated transcriptional regulator EpsA [Burkholderiales bacterium]|jgi:transcriptional regulator EpsA